MSLGWEVVYLILSNSEYFSSWFIKSESLYSFEFSMYEYAFTFCPKRVISLAPFLIKLSTSDKILWNDLEYSGPLVKGTTQKWQNLSHPSWIVKKAETLLLLFSILSKKSNFDIVSNSVSSLCFLET